MDLWNSNRLRVTWSNLRDYWPAPAIVCQHYWSNDHGKSRMEHNFALHIFGRGFHVKWRPDGKDRRPCTCNPDDDPPRPCPRQYALRECREAASKAAENILAPPLDGN